MRSSSIRNRKPKSRGASLPIEQLERRRLLSTVVVNTTADSTDAKGSSTVSLRDAIAVANVAATATTITFSPTVFGTAKTITLGGTQLELSNTKEATTITGPVVGVAISGNAKSRVLDIDAGVSVVASSLTIEDGNSASSEPGGQDHGGGILVNGSLTLSAATIENSYATYFGGGISVVGTLNLSDSTVKGNSSLGTGGIDSYGKLILTNDTVSGNENVNGYTSAGITCSGGTATLDNVTVAGNQELDKGKNAGAGGVAAIIDSTAIPSITLSNCTISDNTSTDAGGLYAGTGSKVTVANTIVAGNTGQIDADASGSMTSLGHNLIGKTNGSSGWISSDYAGTVAKPLSADVGTLANNGGPTETLLPLTGSPAIDKGSNTLIPSGTTTDQRGLPRTYNGTVDIGAVEVQPLIQIKAPASQKATQGISTSVTLGSFTQYTNAAPYKDLITWGDGSATTTLSLTAAGTIPATAHVFAKSGTITVTETITDAKSNKSNTITFTDTVTAPLGSITGTVYNDANGDGKIDDGEIGVGGWTVYLDLKKDGKLDTGDPSVVTTVNGTFSFTGLAAGTYVVRVVPVTGVSATKPTGNVLTIVLAAGQNSIGNLFGEKAA